MINSVNIVNAPRPNCLNYCLLLRKFYYQKIIAINFSFSYFKCRNILKEHSNLGKNFRIVPIISGEKLTTEIVTKSVSYAIICLGHDASIETSSMYYIKIVPYHQIVSQIAKTSHNYEPTIMVNYQACKITIQGNTAGYTGFAMIYEP